MDYFIFSVLVVIIKCNAVKSCMSATGKPGTSDGWSSSLSSSKPLNVVINKPLDLRFPVSIFSGSCHKYDNRAVRLEATISNSMMHIDNVTHSISTAWECIVTGYLYNNTIGPNQFSLFLNLHVKGAKSVQMTVNGKELAFSVADLSAPYDGDTIYFYEDGERVHVVCKNPHSTGSVHFKYFTKDATSLLDSTAVFIQLHSGSNRWNIDCVYNTIEPADTYVYRVTFVTKERLSYLNESKPLTNVKIPGKSSSLILGSSIGAVLVILGLTAVACCYVRTRNVKHTETLYGDITYKNDSQYDSCHYSENVSYKETFHETPESVEDNIDPEDHHYAKIDYSHCQPKIGTLVETQTRNNEVYDEPYAQITAKDRLQALQGV